MANVVVESQAGAGRASIAPAAARSPWIISPFYDLAYLIAAPLAIIPLVSLATWYLSSEQIWLFAASFASIGHHLPGFMRAYGDRELFWRFRWRFVLMPPVILAVVGLMAWQELHAVEVLLLVWATWHVLMQTYGFMRIYDLKRGSVDLTAARLDLLLCVSAFAAGFVFSDGRMHGLMEALWKSGLPLIDAGWLTVARWLCGSFAVAVLMVYAFHVLRSSRRRGVSYIKVIFAVSNAGVYWVVGTVTTDLLIGIAIFEIFHALQYNAVVWTYNRRAVSQNPGRFGPLGFLFHDGWVLIGVYLAAIAAFGSMRYWSDDVSDPVFKAALLAILTTSTALHFYFDGFIWKVSERKTQASLGIEPSGFSVRRDVSWLGHASKWGVLAAGLTGLAMLEINFAPRSPAAEQAMHTALAEWTPELPEVQARASRLALARGDFAAALAAARKAVAFRPASESAWVDLGIAQLQAGRFEEAVAALERAAKLAPKRWQNHRDLGLALTGLQRWSAADEAFAIAAELAPQSAAVELAWAESCTLRGDFKATLRHALAAIEHDRDTAEAYYQAGLAYVQLGQPSLARAQLERATELRPDHAEAMLQLGNAEQMLGDLTSAMRCYRRAIRLRPTSAMAYSNLGAILLVGGQVEEADTMLTRAIELAPHHAQAHYNLGLVRLQQGQLSQARQHIERARALGMTPSAELAEALGFGH
ncbi:MAG: tetratricopeptide repeat protein [Pirellulales bacterium]